PHVVGIPQAESVDRTGRPMPARVAVAIAHGGGLAAHRELDGAAEAAALVGLRIAHDDTSRIMTLHARRRAKRSRTSSRVTNFESGSARRRLTSAACSSINRRSLLSCSSISVNTRVLLAL